MINEDRVPVVIKSNKSNILTDISHLLVSEDYSFSYDGKKCKFTLEIKSVSNLLRIFRAYGFDHFPEVIVNGERVDEFGDVIDQ